MRVTLKSRLAAGLLGCGLLTLAPLPVAANVMEELQVKPGKADNVVRIRFNSRIHFVRYAAAENSSAVQVYFEIVQGADQQLRVVESLRSKPVASLPGITVSFPPQPDIRTKRLLIKFTRRTEATIRPGRTTAVWISCSRMPEKLR